jgi:N-acetylglucosaminyl-diphospho-decaprenol L-rhamnosyltransferase
MNVAVIIVTYKSAALTIECLRSLQSEVATPGLGIRAIVVDNASGDLPAIAAAIQTNGWSSWASCMLAPRNGGFAYGNNLGIEQALGAGPVSYIYLLNPDTEVRRGAIESLVRFLEANPGVGIAGGSFENRDGSDWPIAFRFPTLFSELETGIEAGFVTRLLRPWVVARQMPKLPQPTDWICGAAMMIRSSVFRVIGGLDENYFLYFEETDFCRRAKQAGLSTWYVPESRVMHIAGQSTAVTDTTLGLKRLPAYWFESRRRDLAAAFGLGHAAFIDVAAVLAYSLGWLKRAALRRPSTPYFIRDLITHTILRKRNRAVPTVKSSLSITRSVQ